MLGTKTFCTLTHMMLNTPYCRLYFSTDGVQKYRQQLHDAIHQMKQHHFSLRLWVYSLCWFIVTGTTATYMYIHVVMSNGKQFFTTTCKVIVPVVEYMYKKYQYTRLKCLSSLQACLQFACSHLYLGWFSLSITAILHLIRFIALNFLKATNESSQLKKYNAVCKKYLRY